MKCWQNMCRFAVIAFAVAGAPFAMPEPGVAAEKVARMGAVNAPDSLNPFATWGSFWPTVFNYDFLVGVDAQRHPDRRGFAKEWSVSADELTWTFKIWPGMKWSDGKPATAHDAAFTFNYIKDSIGQPDELNAGWNNTGGFDIIDSITVLDDETFQIKTKKPSSWPVDTTTLIVPAHIWKDIPRSEARSSFQNEPPVVGTGPMVITEWQRGQFFRMAANEHFRAGRPPMDGLIYEIFESTDPLVQGIKRGDLDYVANVTAAQWTDLDADPNIKGGEQKIEQTDFLAFNTWAGETGGGSTKALQDPAFRDAIGYAIDQQVIVDRALQGHGDPGLGPIVPVAATYYSDMKDVRRRFDPAEAKRRLDAAGYRDSDGDGVREDKEGRPFELNLITGTYSGVNEIPTATVQLVATWLTDVGVPVNVTRVDSGALFAQTDSPGKGGGGWDLLIASRWYSPFASDLLRIGSGEAGGSQNVSYWSNPEYDRLFQEQSQTVNPEKRRALVDQAARLLYQEAPYIFLTYPFTLDAHREDRFTGWGTSDAVSSWGYFPWDRLKPR